MATSKSTNHSTETSSQISEDEKAFADILQSMGITQFDPLVPCALNEYARRFVAEILCDAKDYSVHAKRSEITSEDVKLAIKLNEMKLTGIDQSQSAIEEIKNEINQQNLVEFSDENCILHRYPPDLLLQRSYTYVSGAEAYDEFSSKDGETN